MARARSHPQFQPVWGWISRRKRELARELAGDRIAFGEWCFAVHTLRYERLPDWFLGFDVYDLSSNRFSCTERRDRLFSSARVYPVPRLFRQLTRGFREDAPFRGLPAWERPGRGPLHPSRWQRVAGSSREVSPTEFLEEIGDHSSSRSIQPNKLAGDQPTLALSLAPICYNSPRSPRCAVGSPSHVTPEPSRSLFHLSFTSAKETSLEPTHLLSIHRRHCRRGRSRRLPRPSRFRRDNCSPPRAAPPRKSPPTKISGPPSATNSPPTAPSSTSTTATSVPRREPCRRPCAAISTTATWARTTP